MISAASSLRPPSSKNVLNSASVHLPSTLAIVASYFVVTVLIVPQDASKSVKACDQAKMKID
jgi:hypothetical protein